MKKKTLDSFKPARAMGYTTSTQLCWYEFWSEALFQAKSCDVVFLSRSLFLSIAFFFSFFFWPGGTADVSIVDPTCVKLSWQLLL